MKSQNLRTNRSSRFWQRIAPWLDAIAIGGWGLLLLKLWIFGQLYLLVHPNYILLTVCAGFGLVAIAGLEAIRVRWRLRQGTNLDRSDHVTYMMPSWSSSLLITTALLGLLISPRPFASEKAIHRGVTDGINAIRSAPESFRSSNRPEDRTLVEWVRTLNVKPEPDAYTGQKVKVKGFVVYAKDLPDDVFLITRFVITCCAADVYPVSLPVKVSQSRTSYPADKWFEIEGQMTTETLANRRQLLIQASKLTPIPEPQNPYDS
ncbi:TIGR03943 family protein [Tumidithrix elongata RA019]|uniref:TIGR03943 family protein n=1 Tax=Tumidithrix elongata BACA0141 TaxID=2716417 RepID=A0AAW9Q8R6_9CYAN|nr:TIGR03943 family protein [Tumidithrix elongata RA019]